MDLQIFHESLALYRGGGGCCCPPIGLKYYYIIHAFMALNCIQSFKRPFYIGKSHQFVGKIPITSPSKFLFLILDDKKRKYPQFKLKFKCIVSIKIQCTETTHQL